MNKDNRHASRKKYVNTVIVFVNGQTIEATSRNRSIGGMGLVIDHELSMGMPLKILDHGKEFIGSVVWCRLHAKDRYYIGVSYHKKELDDILTEI